jgi:4-alpha-glucanotransferase
MLDRSSGILMPISSLPSKYGIGTFGREAYNFIDFLHAAGQKYWQLLPIGPVSYGDSPYSSFSAFAGNPYYIDLEPLIEKGILSYEDCKVLDSDDEYVDYEKQFNFRYKILYNAFINCKLKYLSEINEFRNNNQWAADYSLFMALKYHFNQMPWYEWDEGISDRNEEALEKYRQLLRDKTEFWIFLQVLFFEQYYKLKDYACKKGISIIGDIPIYAAKDSVEAWAERKLFEVDENMKLSMAAGVPPDSFSDKGQLWGNPVYNWGYLKENSYEWWIKRLKWSFRLYDVVRIDHFRGFDEFWAVPVGSENAIMGKWLPAGGKELFEQAIKELRKLNIIAEDLGIITDSVIKLRNELSFPGMKVLQFAFDGNRSNPYLPQNYEENSVVYTGTHDNDTLRGWLESLDMDTKLYALNRLNINVDIKEDIIIDKIIEKALESKAGKAVIPLQDYLHLDSRGRINTPSTLGGNWMWRVKKEMLTNELIDKIRTMTIKSGRI